MNRFDYSKSNGALVSFIVAAISFYISSITGPAVFDIALKIIGFLAVYTCYIYLSEDVSTLINRCVHTPLTIYLNLNAIQKDDSGRAINSLFIKIEYLWLRSSPRIGETIKLEDVLGEQCDFILDDDFTYIDIHRIVHLNSNLIIFSDYNTSAKSILAKFEELHSHIASLGRAKVETTSSDFSPVKQVLLHRQPVTVGYEYSSEEYIPKLERPRPDSIVAGL